MSRIDPMADLDPATVKNQLSRAEARLAELDAVRTLSLAISEQKVALFLELFRGRTDVYPKRWVNPKRGGARGTFFRATDEDAVGQLYLREA